MNQHQLNSYFIIPEFFNPKFYLKKYGDYCIIPNLEASGILTNIKINKYGK
jgi:hypothetical protein